MKDLNMRLLITGGSGFIGTEVVRQALAHGLDVVSIDIQPPSDPSHHSLWREGDVRDAAFVAGVVHEVRPQFVAHLASDIRTDLPSLAAYETTLQGTRNVLDAVAAQPSVEKFTHVSTQFVVKPGNPVADERYYFPYTLYGAAKAESEKYVWQTQLGCDWIIVRPTIIWGPHHPTAAGEIFRHISKRTYLQPYGRQPILRAAGYVVNTASQLLALATGLSNDSKRRVYYLGDGILKYDDWVDAFSKGLTGKRARRIPAPLLKFMGKAGDIAKMVGIPSPIDSGRAFRMSTSSEIDLSPVLELLGPPPIDFQTGVNVTLSWLKGLDDS